MRAALRRRYSGIVGADPGKRPSVLLEHAGAWAYSLRSPSAVEGLLVRFPRSHHRARGGSTAKIRDPCGQAGRFRRAVCFRRDRKSTRLNSSHVAISYAVFCLKKKKKKKIKSSHTKFTELTS